VPIDVFVTLLALPHWQLAVRHHAYGRDQVFIAHYHQLVEGLSPLRGHVNAACGGRVHRQFPAGPAHHTPVRPAALIAGGLAVSVIGLVAESDVQRSLSAPLEQQFTR
jgi:hypothetical protein